jgi:hypothetical protein
MSGTKTCARYVITTSARQESSSHRVYKTSWPGDPRVNIQCEKGNAKTYQVRQVLKAVEKMENRHDTKE